MTREYSHRSLGEESEALSDQKIVETALRGIEAFGTSLVHHSAQSLRELLNNLDAKGKEYHHGRAGISLDGSRLSANRLPRGEAAEDSEEFIIKIGWNEAGIVDDVVAEYREHDSGQIKRNTRFGSGLSAPDNTGMPNTLSSWAVVRELGHIKHRVRHPGRHTPPLD